MVTINQRVVSVMVFATLAMHSTVDVETLSQDTLVDKNRQTFPLAPSARVGALEPSVREALAKIVPSLRQRRFPEEAVQTIGRSGDSRKKR